MNKTEAIVQMISDGIPAKQISEEVRCSTSLIYAVAKRNDIKLPERKTLQPYMDEIVQLVNDGVALREIARRYNKTRNTIRDFCRVNGIVQSEETKYKLQHRKHSDEYIRQNVLQYGVEYVSGYKNANSKFTVRCLVCNNTFETSLNVLRYSVGECPHCKEAERKERKAKQEQERQQRQELKSQTQAIRKQQAEAEREQKRLARFHACPVCGKITDRTKYCSVACSKKADNKSKELQRRNRISSALVDKDITVEGLYRRDGGLCHICGALCLWDDYISKDSTIICGNYYPSIDHVIPLSKGGKHSWDNVKLAHRICNSIKADSIYAPHIA